MTSINFEHLRKQTEDLAALGAFAEQYIHNDPQSALVKLRMFVERMVISIYRDLGMPQPPQSTLIDLLNNATFREVAPKVVLDKLHSIRIHGNKAAHGEKVNPHTGLWLLREAYDLGRWFYIAYQNGDAQSCTPYKEPIAGETGADTKAKLKKEKKAALEKLAAQEVQLNTLLKELETARAQAQIVEKQLADITTASATAQNAADVLEFSEAETRQRLIDSQLVAAGWDVGADGANTEEVGQEVPVDHQPTQTGTGYIDYVLWDDNGMPLAVIEAKKTAVDAEKGRTQAKLYADGLKEMKGQRPVIFYTNGFDIWIWDDAQNYPPRKLYGFYSKDSLQYLLYQRSARKDLNTLSPSGEIAGRMYQVEAIKQVTERFSAQRRKALIVQATGTGKTRVAISLTELLIRARWVKRVLFLCDRRELRKQAKNAYNDFLSEPLVIVGARTANDRDKRIYLSTYPAISKIYQTFDVGFFDLIIADESHRSIYNVYGDIFKYFDCFQIGLTATPVEFVSRNTYQLFDCENQLPTAYYSLERAIDENHLVPFEVKTFTTDFLRKGIKYKQLTEEQRKQLEEDGENPELLNYEVKDVDKNIFNKDTGRLIIRNLMENGIRDANEQEIGKSIVFARNHEHAVQLNKVFDEMYPQYGGKFCQVIDNYDPRAEQLIDDFKDANNELTIAISVDMLDTGIDVPEVVNLVFAKPVYSKVKFWQMIGRGTRLCKDLFGPGRDKQGFYIFDHWGNFDYFDFHYKAIEPTQSKSLMQQVFDTRIELAEAAIQAAEPDFFQIIADLIEADIRALPEDSIAVKDKWRIKRQLEQKQVLQQWDPVTVASLKTDIAPLMLWRNIRGHTEAYDLDLLIARMQIERLQGSGRFDDLKIKLLEKVNNLQMHLNPVREKAEIIKQLRSSSFWEKVTVNDLEIARKELRSIIHHRQKGGGIPGTTKVIDVAEDVNAIQSDTRSSSIHSVDMKVYQKQVEEVLCQLFDKDPTLQKIRNGEAVTEKELKSLTSLVLTQNPDVRLDVLTEFYESTLPLDFIIRSIVGMEPEAVKTRFESFLQKHPTLSAKQTRFMNLLQNHIAKYGAIEIERLYENPFTVVDTDGIDGVFAENEADELINIINTFQPTTDQETKQ